MKTADVIRALCKKRGMSVTSLEDILGFGNGSLTKDTYPRSDRLYKVAQYFSVSMEYLITGETCDSIPSLSYEEDAVLQAYREADDSIKVGVCKLLDVKRDLRSLREVANNGIV